MLGRSPEERGTSVSGPTVTTDVTTEGRTAGPFGSLLGELSALLAPVRRTLSYLEIDTRLLGMSLALATTCTASHPLPNTIFLPPHTPPTPSHPTPPTPSLP